MHNPTYEVVKYSEMYSGERYNVAAVLRGPLTNINPESEFAKKLGPRKRKTYEVLCSIDVVGELIAKFFADSMLRHRFDIATLLERKNGLIQIPSVAVYQTHTDWTDYTTGTIRPGKSLHVFHFYTPTPHRRQGHATKLANEFLSRIAQSEGYSWVRFGAGGNEIVDHIYEKIAKEANHPANHIFRCCGTPYEKNWIKIADRHGQFPLEITKDTK